MAGLLDFLSMPSSGGGLLDFLRQNALNQPMQQGGLASDQAQYGQLPQQQPFNLPAPQIQPSVPQNPPPVIQAQPQAPAVAASSPQMGAPSPQSGGFGAGLTGFISNLHTGPLGALTGGIAAGMGLQDPHTAGVQRVANLTANALIGKGIDPQIALAAVQPGNTEMLKQLVDQKFGAPKPPTTLGQGYIYNPQSNKVERAYEPDDVNQVVKIGQDAMGREQYGVFNKGTGKIEPYQPSGKSGTEGGIGDMSKTGEDYIATVPVAQRSTLKGMLDGTVQPPSGFAMTKPYWQTLIAAAKQADPTFDENTWASRHKMAVDMAASGNSSIGGILSNGKSSFKHLAEYTQSAADLGNVSHDFPGGSAVATAQNYLGNKAFAGSDTAAKIKAINDNLGHYGQESTKFYAGTGGGVEERMNALKEMNPVTTSSAEMAAYAAKEKSLMLDRLHEKESQIRDIMGEAYLQKHPVFTPELQRDIDRIDANVAKLRGQAPPATGAAPSKSGLPAGWNVQVH